MKRNAKETRFINGLRSYLHRFPEKPKKLAVYEEQYQLLTRIKNKLEKEKAAAYAVYPGLRFSESRIFLDDVELYPYDR